MDERGEKTANRLKRRELPGWEKGSRRSRRARYIDEIRTIDRGKAPPMHSKSVGDRDRNGNVKNIEREREGERKSSKHRGEVHENCSTKLYRTEHKKADRSVRAKGRQAGRRASSGMGVVYRKLYRRVTPNWWIYQYSLIYAAYTFRWRDRLEILICLVLFGRSFSTSYATLSDATVRIQIFVIWVKVTNTPQFIRTFNLQWSLAYMNLNRVNRIICGVVCNFATLSRTQLHLDQFATCLYCKLQTWQLRFQTIRSCCVKNGKNEVLVNVEQKFGSINTLATYLCLLFMKCLF